ncbi:MAG TPA: histidine phosphatase family protein [Candidatus Acidoferrales bacterium]|nr:histidine phosphatase family protein [Candidatus Acidoferrales bacterium]
MIVLCRHGATDGNAAGAFLSRSDPPLNATGIAQCLNLREALRDARFARCFVSPSLRCLQTRSLVAPDVAYDVVPALREVDFGEWEGRTLEWLVANDPRGVRRRRHDPVSFRPPQGESFADVAVRLAELAGRLSVAADALVVGHRGTLGVLERLLRGLPLRSSAVAPMEPGEYHTIE